MTSAAKLGGVVAASRYPVLLWPVFFLNACLSVRFSGYVHA